MSGHEYLIGQQKYKLLIVDERFWFREISDEKVSQVQLPRPINSKYLNGRGTPLLLEAKWLDSSGPIRGENVKIYDTI